MSVTDRALLFDSGGTIVSTAVLCPGYAFVQYGSGGPRFAPDQHWVLVDILGPYAPGNVIRTHVLVDVRTGTLVRATAFRRVLGLPDAPDSLAWASGERQTLRYPDGATHDVSDARGTLPREPCAAAR
ncbi:MAG: hypothetical protein NVS3B17_21020 [Vulcanimicrobiaceae bacterium]